MSDSHEKSEEKQITRVKDEKGRMVFPKGVSGNPNGRPLGKKNLTTLLGNALEKVTYKNEKGEDVQAEVVLIKKLLDLAIVRGNIKALELIFKYIDGLPTQNIDLGGQVNVAYVDVLKAIKEKEQLYDTKTGTNTKDKE